MAYKRILFLLLLLCSGLLLMAQATFPENGVADPRVGYYAFTHATLVKDANMVVSNGDLLDMRSSNVTAAFIQGRKIDLTDKHKLLNDRFEQKYEIKPKKGF